MSGVVRFKRAVGKFIACGAIQSEIVAKVHVGLVPFCVEGVGRDRTGAVAEAGARVRGVSWQLLTFRT